MSNRDNCTPDNSSSLRVMGGTYDWEPEALSGPKAPKKGTIFTRILGPFSLLQVNPTTGELLGIFDYVEIFRFSLKNLKNITFTINSQFESAPDAGILPIPSAISSINRFIGHSSGSRTVLKESAVSNLTGPMKLVLEDFNTYEEVSIESRIIVGGFDGDPSVLGGSNFILGIDNKFFVNITARAEVSS